MDWQPNHVSGGRGPAAGAQRRLAVCDPRPPRPAARRRLARHMAAGQRAAGAASGGRTGRARDRARTLIGRRAAVLAGLRSVGTATGGTLEPVLDGATSWQELLA